MVCQLVVLRNVAQPKGEEVSDCSNNLIETSLLLSSAIVVHALLDSKKCAGRTDFGNLPRQAQLALT